MNAMLARVLLAVAALALQPLSIAACSGASVAAEGRDQTELDRMIGQMILVGFPGKFERDARVAAAQKQIAEGTVGGVVLFPENISSPKQLKARVRARPEKWLRQRRPAPYFVTIVARLAGNRGRAGRQEL